MISDIMEEKDNKNKDPKQILKKVKEERDRYLENWQRTQADFENYKKDEEKRLQEFQDWIKREFIFQLIPILDSFNEALNRISSEQEKKSWMEGISSIRDQILLVLKREGVELIEPKKGDQFDPRFHEVVSEAKDCNDKIAKLLQPGYKIGETVLRPARVKLMRDENLKN